jgi:hypothetical protein
MKMLKLSGRNDRNITGFIAGEFGEKDVAEERKYIEIENKDSYGITWYEHALAYYGSHRGMRFRIARDPMEDVSLAPADKKGEATFKITIWPEPYSFDNTPEEEKETNSFPFDEAGKEEMIKWLNEQYREQFDRWEAVRAKH